VVGEDLGTVEPEVHDALRSSGVLGTKVWWFDQGCEHWPAANLATVTTHDLPTVAGVWYGADGSAGMAEALHALVPQGSAADAAVAVHRVVGASASSLVLATTDDLVGMVERPNHPGTTAAEQPNWCRRLPIATGAILEAEPGAAIVADLQRLRVSSAREGTSGR
jgi:4-alpha-glucanotransferase